MPILHKTETDAVISRLRYSRNECERRSIIIESHPELAHPGSGFSDEQASEMLKRLKHRNRGPLLD